MEIAERNAKQTDEAIGERYATSARGTRKSRRRGRGEAPVAETPAEPAAPAQEAPAPDQSMSFIANEENAQRVGFDKQSNLWKPHGSLEGGNATLAYGHKITDEEKASGVIKIGNESVRIDAGLTETQALKLLEQDTAIARDAVDSLVTVPLNANQKEALTSLVYNVGVGSFKKSAALRALNAGDMKTFREEAFGAKGWVNYKGHPGGLKARRKREEDKFFGK